LLRPTPEEVLTSISYTFDTLIRPDPGGAMATSYALTVSNMLRQLLLTMRHEETAIASDTLELRQVLDRAACFLATVECDAESVAEINSALALVPASPAAAAAARENWRSLRGVLQRTIARLQSLRCSYGAQDEYGAIRQAIRDYLDRSLERERILLDGAFTIARR
jgi:hypothetical protein